MTLHVKTLQSGTVICIFSKLSLNYITNEISVTPRLDSGQVVKPIICHINLLFYIKFKQIEHIIIYYTSLIFSG